jgi:cell wall-associated NlpC family hydrolase
MKFRKFLGVILFSAFVLVSQNFAQERERVVGNERSNQPQINRESQPVTPTRNPISRPVLTNQIRIVTNNTPTAPLVKKTASSRPTNAPPSSSPTNYTSNQSLAAFNQRLIRAMQSRIGIPYHYGSDGPNTYDCSGLVWSVFQDAGLTFTRTSAASYYRTFEPVYGDERYKFGTLVFFNGLGHVGVVIDQNTFYQASSSKGVTFSPFAGYWEKRIVGFRRIPLNMF